MHDGYAWCEFHLHCPQLVVFVKKLLVPRQPSIEIPRNNLATDSGACCWLTCFHIRLALKFRCRHLPISLEIFPLSCGNVTPNRDAHTHDFFQVSQSKYVLGRFIPSPTVGHTCNIRDIRINILDILQG